jgi:hypothetical protein
MTGAVRVVIRRILSRGSHDRSATTGAERHHEQFCTKVLELAVVAGHHINPGEPPDFSSCFGDHSLAVTAFQIRGRVFDDEGSNEIGRGGHNAILRRTSCHLLRGKTAISEEFVRNLPSAGPYAGATRGTLQRSLRNHPRRKGPTNEPRPPQTHEHQTGSACWRYPPAHRDSGHQSTRPPDSNGSKKPPPNTKRGGPQTMPDDDLSREELVSRAQHALERVFPFRD